MLETNHYWYLLERAGVHLATVNQGRIDWNSIAGWLVASIKQHGDAQHRFQLFADVKRGKRRVAEKGVWQGRVPFGYATDDNRRLVLGNPVEIDLVRRIFREYVEGRSLRNIAYALNVEGLSVLNNGRGWVPNGIRDKLINPAYVGVFKWNEIEIHDNHPAIIDVVTFERVQRLLGERQGRTTPHEGGGGFLFTGLLRCGKCGAPMSGSNPEQHYFKCRGAMERGSSKCEGSTIKQAELLEHVLKALEGDVFTPAFVKRLREAITRQATQECQKADPERLRKELASVAAKLVKAKRRLMEVDMDMLPVAQEQIRNLLAEQARLQATLEASQTPLESFLAQHDQLIERAMQTFSAFGQTFGRADPQEQRQLLQERITRLEVWTDKLANGRKVSYQLVRGRLTPRADNLFTSPA